MSGDWTETLRLSVAAGRAWMRGDVARCQQILQHQRDSAGADPRAELAALTASALLGALSGRLVQARADLAAAGTRLQSLGFAAFGPQWEQAALVCDWLSGEWVEAEARSARLEAVPPRPAMISLGLRVELLRETGRREAAERVLSRLGVESEAPLVAWLQAGMDGDRHRLVDAARQAPSGMRPWILHRTAAIAWCHRDYELAREADADFDRLDRDEPVTRVLAGLARAYATRQAGPARCMQPIAESEGASPLVAECLTVRGYLGEDTLPAARDAWQRIGGRLRVSEIAAFLGEPAPERLTRREGELVELVQAGHGNQAIAGILHLSIKTVETYLTRIYAKTGCTSRLELAAAAAEGRLPPADQ